MATTGLNSVDDIPRQWRSALAAVQITYPEAVIAGGCLRDRENGVKVKDIDIFVSEKIVPTADIERKLRRDGWAEVRMDGDATYNGDATDRKIVGVFDLTFPGTSQVQLIAMQQFRLEEIDFGICQIMFDGKRIVRLPDYHHDLAAKQFRIIPKMSDTLYVRSLERWARLKEKYPTWKLHLGSRADVPFQPPKSRSITPEPGNMFALSDGSIKAYLDTGFRNQHMVMMQPGDYVVPRRVADRLAKETTAKIVSIDHSGKSVTIHIDSRATGPSATIIRDILEADRRFQQDMEARRQDTADALFRSAGGSLGFGRP